MLKRSALFLAVVASVTMTLGVASPSSASPAPALHLDDQLDWCFWLNQAGTSFNPGDTVTEQLRIGNGITGQAGYARRNVSPHGFFSGSSTALNFGANHDDGSVQVNLPFKFPFAGIKYNTMSVTTNGWAGFGQAAWDYYPDCTESLLASTEFFRGVMPWRRDLDLNTGGGGGAQVGEVDFSLAFDESKFAVIWFEMQTHDSGTGDPERNFQAVFFRDGRIRFDYPGNNPTATSNEAFVGLIGGNGASNSTIVSDDALTVPNRSILFRPKGVDATRDDGRNAKFRFPAGSSFVSADPRCTLTQAPTGSVEGIVRCDVPSLAVGHQTTFPISWTTPGTGNPFDQSATYRGRDDLEQSFRMA
jgi:hypothetical protein